MGTIENDILVSNDDLAKDEVDSRATASESGDNYAGFIGEKLTDPDIDSDSAASVLNYLNDINFRSPLRTSSSHMDKSAIIRLNSELLKAKRSNWEVVDALNTAHDDIRDLRKREQRLNDLLKNNFIDGGALDQDTIRRTEFKILNTQLEIRDEELLKTKDIVRRLMGERDRLKDECSQTRANLNLLTLQDKRKENELEVVQNNLRSLKEQQKMKDDNSLALRENTIHLEHQLRAAKNAAVKAEEQVATLRETVNLRAKEITDLTNRLKKLEDENNFVNSQLSQKDAEIREMKDNEQAVFREVEHELASELANMQLEFNEMQLKSKGDERKIAEMAEKLKKWERMSKAMDDYVHEANSRQIQARQEIAKYIEDLERQLSACKSGQRNLEKARTHHRVKPGRNRHTSADANWAVSSSFESHSSDSSLSCVNPDSAESIQFEHASSDIVGVTAISFGKSKGRRRTLPLTPSDIEALSDDSAKKNRISTRRRRMQDSGIGESLIGFDNQPGRRYVYPWKQIQNESKFRFLNSSPVKFADKQAENDSDSLVSITPLSVVTRSPNSSGIDCESQDKQTKVNRKSSSFERVPLSRFLSLDRARAHRRHAALLLVFRYLTPLELCSISKVCREWRSLSEHPSLWKNIAIINSKVNNMSLLSISRRCKPLESLILIGVRRTSQAVTEPTDNCYLEKGLEYILKVAESSLLSLHLEDCENLLTDRCLLLAGSHCHNLESLTYISEFYPACPESLWSLWNCKSLTSLRVPPMTPSEHPYRFNDKSCETIANCWPGLRKLTIGGLGITTTGLIHIAQGCLRLQELELDHTHYVTEETASAVCQFGFKGLQVLLFTFTPVSPAAIKHFYATCPRLEYIAPHVGISDYFSDVNNPNNVRKFTRMVNKIEVSSKCVCTQIDPQATSKCCNNKKVLKRRSQVRSC